MLKLLLKGVMNYQHGGAETGHEGGAGGTETVSPERVTLTAQYHTKALRRHSRQYRFTTLGNKWNRAFLKAANSLISQCLLEKIFNSNISL